MSEILKVLKDIREELAEIKNKITNTMVKKEDVEGHIYHALDNNGTIKDIRDKVTYLYERRCKMDK